MTASTSSASDLLPPPLQKGGWGEFAFALSGRAQGSQQKQKQKRIPRVRCAVAAPFCKGGNSGLPRAQSQSLLHMMTALTSPASDLLFPPLQKGGRGGFAFALSDGAEGLQQTQKQKRIPRVRFAVAAPFCKGGNSGLPQAQQRSQRQPQPQTQLRLQLLQSLPQPPFAAPQTPSPDPHRRETPAAPSRRMQRKPS